MAILEVVVPCVAKWILLKRSSLILDKMTFNLIERLVWAVDPKR